MADGRSGETFIRVRLDVGQRLFKIRGQKYAGTSEKGELLIGDLHDVLPPPLVALGVDREACGVPTRKLPSPPTLLGLQLHPFWSTAFAFPFFGFQFLDGLWFVVRTPEYARIAVALPALAHRTAPSVHPTAAPGVPATAPSSRRCVAA